MEKKYTYDIIKKMFDDRGYILLSTEYVSYSKHLEYICPKHEHKGILKITLANFVKGRGCPHCAKRARKTHEEYLAELHEIFPNIDPLENYVTLKTKILHRCNVCGYKWKAKPDNTIHAKEGCPKCNGNYQRTQEELVEDVAKINPYIEVIGQFVRTAVPIEFKCKICGNVWKAKPNNILNGRGCPKCKMSVGERKISQYLDENNIQYDTQHIFDDCIYTDYLKFDFFLPEYNIAIEYDGIQHFKPARFLILCLMSKQ